MGPACTTHDISWRLLGCDGGDSLAVSPEDVQVYGLIRWGLLCGTSVSRPPGTSPVRTAEPNRNPEPTQRAYAFTSEWSFVIRPWKSTVLGLRPVLLPRFHHMLSSTLPKRYCHSSSSPPPVKKLKWAGAYSEEKYHLTVSWPHKV